MTGAVEHGMTISVKDLPDCQHKRLLSIIAKPEARICVIAVQLPIGKWIAYAGFPDVKDLKIQTGTPNSSSIEFDCEHIHSVEAVKMLGRIIEKEAAVQLFDWNADQYTTVGF